MLLLTEKQYELVKKMLPLMEHLYKNDLVPLFKLIAEDYGDEAGAAEKAAAIINDMGITAPNIRKAMQLSSLSSTWKLEAHTIKNGPFVYTVELDDLEKRLLEKTLDVFSRIVMGQLHILFETMDMPENLQDNQHAVEMYHDVYWDGLHGAKDARDLLFPAIKDFGWHGGYGIASKEVAEDARLAYQLNRALCTNYVLPVTDEPLAQLA